MEPEAAGGGVGVVVEAGFGVGEPGGRRAVVVRRCRGLVEDAPA